MPIETLIANVESSADWRAEKAKEYPDDRRNVRSSDALKELARNLAQLPGDDENVAAYEAAEERLLELDENYSTSEYESALISRYGFDYPVDGDAVDFLSVLIEEFQDRVKDAEERVAEEERERAYEAACEVADEEAKEAAHERAVEVAQEAARNAADEAYQQAYDEAYKEAYEEAYKESLTNALSE